jgi:membrane protein insertase Oxa1/YidC/SpoIIIJ
MWGHLSKMKGSSFLKGIQPKESGVVGAICRHSKVRTSQQQQQQQQQMLMFFSRFLFLFLFLFSVSI